MLMDTTGTTLIPGNFGKDCPGNGEQGFPCCCEECDYYICCLNESDPDCCGLCSDEQCRRKQLTGYQTN